MTAPVQQCQPVTETLPERLRLNSCRRAHETPDDAATRRLSTEMEAANWIESMEWGVASVALALNWTDLKGVSLEDHARALQARVEELTKALEWRPIETAPLDGSAVLVCKSMENRSVCEAFWSNGAWRCWDGENDTRTSFIDGYLTHWRPMPDASTMSLEDRK